MAVVAADILFFGSVNQPEDDTAAAGGAIQSTGHASGGRKVEATDIAATDTAQVLSDGADTRTATVTGRLTTGAIQSEALVLNGTSPVTSTNQWERIEKLVLSSKDASRTVTLRRTTGGATITTLGPNYTELRRLFYDAASAGSTKTRYNLAYAVNNNGSSSLLNAKAKLVSDPVSRLRLGLETAKGDAAATSNRLTAPGGVSFVDDNVSIDVPTTTLAAGERIGCWVEQSVPANDPAFKSTGTIEISGNSA